MAMLRLPFLAFAGLVCALSGPAGAQSRPLRYSEGADNGALFRAFYERAFYCPHAIHNGPSGTSVRIELDCRNKVGTVATFELFEKIRLDAPWTVTGFGSTGGATLSTPSGTNPRARVRLSAGNGSRVIVDLTITISPTLLPEAVPQCLPALQQRPRDFVCHSDADCVPPNTAGTAQSCSADCGNRCVPKQP